MKLYLLKQYRHMILFPQDQQKLLQQLDKLWLHKTDAQIYLASIHIGACTINQLTSQTKINRITVHDSIGRLIEKGLLLETFSGRRRLVFPQQINHLQHLVEKKKTEMDQLQYDVATTINLLQSLHLQSSSLPQVRISKGSAGIEEMLREIKEWDEWMIQTISDSRHFDELLNVHFLDSLQSYKQPIQMILPSWFEHFIFSANAKGLQIDTRTITQDMKRQGGMTMWWSKVAFHAYEWVYITTTIIENIPITNMMSQCFESIWQKCTIE